MENFSIQDLDNPQGARTGNKVREPLNDRHVSLVSLSMDAGHIMWEIYVAD